MDVGELTNLLNVHAAEWIVMSCLVIYHNCCWMDLGEVKEWRRRNFIDAIGSLLNECS
jgi:hypothetical protein